MYTTWYYTFCVVLYSADGAYVGLTRPVLLVQRLRVRLGARAMRRARCSAAGRVFGIADRLALCARMDAAPWLRVGLWGLRARGQDDAHAPADDSERARL